MPYYRINGQLMHVKFGKSKKRPPPAPCCARIRVDGVPQRCLVPSEYLCDHQNADGSTCDAPLCADHAHETGPDHHMCPMHRTDRTHP